MLKIRMSSLPPSSNGICAKSLPAATAKELSRLIVRVLPRTSFKSSPRGLLQAGAQTFPCALGAGALTRHKREGDGASPAGRFRLIAGYFRLTGPRVNAPWPLQPIRKCDGWCDDPHSPSYNRPLRLPSLYHCEKMWRNDGLYDLVIVLDYNLWPRRMGGGSAIFLHCARQDFAPTAGCIALRKGDLRKLLLQLGKNAVLIVR